MHSWERRKQLLYVQTWKSANKYSSVSPSLKVLSQASCPHPGPPPTRDFPVLPCLLWLVGVCPHICFYFKCAFRPVVCVSRPLWCWWEKAAKKETKNLQMGFPYSACLLNQNSLRQFQLIHVVCAAALRRKTQLQMSRHKSANVTEPQQKSIDN